MLPSQLCQRVNMLQCRDIFFNSVCLSQPTIVIAFYLRLGESTKGCNERYRSHPLNWCDQLIEGPRGGNLFFFYVDNPFHIVSTANSDTIWDHQFMPSLKNGVFYTYIHTTPHHCHYTTLLFSLTIW